MPNGLSRKLKRVAVERKTTMRALIIDAIEQSLDEPKPRFSLRDASVGDAMGQRMGPDGVNQAIDSLREPNFRQ